MVDSILSWGQSQVQALQNLSNELQKLQAVGSSSAPVPQQNLPTDTFQVTIPSLSQVSNGLNNFADTVVYGFKGIGQSISEGFNNNNLGQLLQGTSFAGANPPTSNTFSSKVKEMTPFVSESALQLVKVFEGFKDKSYTGAGAGDKTIGFGSSELSGKPKVLAALAKGSVTIEEAENLMLEEVQGLRPVVEKHFGNQLNPNQFGVLISLAYNGGEQALIDLKSKSGGDLQKVGEILPSFYVTSGGQYLEGLSNRRKVEQKLWNSPANA